MDFKDCGANEEILLSLRDHEFKAGNHLSSLLSGRSASSPTTPTFLPFSLRCLVACASRSDLFVKPSQSVCINQDLNAPVFVFGLPPSALKKEKKRVSDVTSGAKQIVHLNGLAALNLQALDKSGLLEKSQVVVKRVGLVVCFLTQSIDLLQLEAAHIGL